MTRPSDCVTQRLKTRITWLKCSAVPRIGFLNSCFPLLVYPHHTGEPSPRALLEAGLRIQGDSFHFSVKAVANYTDFIHVATCTNLTGPWLQFSPALLSSWLHLLELPPVMPHSAGRTEGWEGPHSALLVSHCLPGKALKTTGGRSLVKKSVAFRKKSGTWEEMEMFQHHHL